MLIVSWLEVLPKFNMPLATLMLLLLTPLSVKSKFAPPAVGKVSPVAPLTVKVGVVLTLSPTTTVGVPAPRVKLPLIAAPSWSTTHRWCPRP